MRVLAWIRSIAGEVFRRSQSEGEMEEELRGHIERRAGDLEREGLTREEAERRANIEFGGYEKYREETREARGGHFFETVVQDVRFGLRMLRKSPGFTAVAVLTLALGIGANTAIFSIVDSLLLRPLPVQDPGQLTVLAFRQGSGPLLTQFSIPDYRDIATQAKSVFSGVYGIQLGFDGIAVEGKADRTLTAYVTGNYFTSLGLKPFLGRLILPSEGQTPGADPVVVLSYAYWQGHLGADRFVIGRRILVNGHPSTVVGVAPQGFDGLYPAPGVEAYLPLGMVGSYEQGWASNWMVNRIIQNVYLLGRLRPGVTVGDAGAALNVIAARLSAQYPDTNKGMRLSVYSERFARPDPGTAGTLIKAAA